MLKMLMPIATSTLIWTSLYHLLVYRLHPNKTKEYCSRLLSLAHGLIASYLGLRQCFVINSPNAPTQHLIAVQTNLMIFSLGYFLYDLVWMYYNQWDEKLYVVHHVYCIMVLWVLLLKGEYRSQACCALGGLEVSNPFLQSRWFLRSEGFYPSPVHTASEVLFMMVFVGVRVFLGSYYLAKVLKSEEIDAYFMVMGVSIYFISMLFFVNIVRFALIKFGFMSKE